MPRVLPNMCCPALGCELGSMFQMFFGTALPRWHVQQVTPTPWTWLVQLALILRVICSILRATIFV